MKPIDFRNETFAQLRGRLAGLREQVWLAWIAHGPATTRACAEKSGLDLLTFRPRTTELYQIGALMLEEPEVGSPKSEGIYRARSHEEWQQWHAAQQHAATSGQLQLV